MATPNATPMAQKRRPKTRTKRVSTRPALAVSTLLPNQIDLLPGTESLVCPDCGTWCPITGHQSSTPKLVPHHTERAGSPEGRRCIGSNRRVQLDLTIPEWRHRLGDAVSDTASRRATRVLRKPKAATAPAVSQVKDPPLSADMIRRTFRAHQAQCAACKGEATSRDGEPLPCPDGERLAATYLRLLRQEPKRAKVREFFAKERARFDQLQLAERPKRRAAEWAKHGGTAAEEANNQCRAIPKGAVSEFRGPDVPLDPIHITF